MNRANKFEKLLQTFDYKFPQALIAAKPAKPRDSAKLLIYNRANNKISFNTFHNIGKYLPKNSVLVFNQTKVVPARLTVQKETGGKAEILYLSHNKKNIKVLSNRNLQPNTSVRIKLGRALSEQKFLVIKKQKQFYFLKPSFPIKNIKQILFKYGQTPLPPYIKNSPLTEKQRREQYQTVFAKTGLSVAAPTASLHFTKKLMKSLKKQGIAIKFVELDVNLGTFAPLKDENLTSGTLHYENYNIDKSVAKFLNQAKAQGRPIIAVGTTVVRTLESASGAMSSRNFSLTGLSGDAKNIRDPDNRLTKLSGNTNLFIQPGYKFKFTNGIITNFHVPKSSLLMLVTAFNGRDEILDVYQRAIKNNFRLFSFGDGMLILP